MADYRLHFNDSEPTSFQVTAGSYSTVSLKSAEPKTPGDFVLSLDPGTPAFATGAVVTLNLDQSDPTSRKAEPTSVQVQTTITKVAITKKGEEFTLTLS